jgi:hypothetical protein
MKQLPIGQRIKVHCPTASGGIYDQDATVRGYDESEMLVRFDSYRYVTRLPSDWPFDLIPGELVSHWQVWEVGGEGGDRPLGDFETPTQAKYFAKQRDDESHRVASRHDDWIPPPRFEVRAVPISLTD